MAADHGYWLDEPFDERLSDELRRALWRQVNGIGKGQDAGEQG